MAKKKYLRVETVHNSDTVLLVDELGRFHAEIDSDTFYGDCCMTSQRFEDGLYWLADLEMVEKNRI